MPRPAEQRETTLLALLHKVAEAALPPTRTPTETPNDTNPPPTTVNNKEDEDTPLLAPAELTLAAL